MTVVIVFAIMGLAWASAVQAADNYTIAAIAPAAGGGCGGDKSSIAADGRVASTRQTAQPAGPARRGFRSDNGTLTDIGTFTGTGESVACGINATGLVTGWANAAGPNHAYRWDGIALRDLGVLARYQSGGEFSAGYDLNGAGVVVGASSVRANSAQHAFKYDTRMRDLGVLPGMVFSAAYGINGSGNIVGSSWNLNPQVSRAFLHNGSIQDIGTLGGGEAAAYDVNDATVIVGTSRATSGSWHAFRYQGGIMTDMTPAALDAAAYGVNNAGELVGEADGRAFLYAGGQLVDLNNLIPDNSGWVLRRADGINDSGHIVGEGTFNGQLFTFKLTPTLLAKYMPELRYDSLDTFRADSAATLTDNQTPEYANALLEAQSGLELADAHGELSLGYLGAYYPDDREALATDFIDAHNGTYELDASRMHETTTYGDRIYGRMRSYPSGAVILQYWFFYYFNWHPSITDFGDHEGDWEGVQIHLGTDGSPISAVYSQHDESHRCDWSTLELNALGRPVVYVARGTHASYFEAGDHYYGSFPPLLDQALGDVVSDPAKLEDISEEPGPGWLTWPGRWGASAASDPFPSPEGPARKGQRWTDPKLWGESQPTGGCPNSSQPGSGMVRAPRTEEPAVSATRQDGIVRVTYSVASDVSPSEPSILVTSIQGRDRDFPPISHRQELTSPNGYYERDAALGSGPFVLRAVLYTARGEVSEPVTVAFR